jgi:hypothetical protein
LAIPDRSPETGTRRTRTKTAIKAIKIGNDDAFDKNFAILTWNFIFISICCFDKNIIADNTSFVPLQ